MRVSQATTTESESGSEHVSSHGPARAARARSGTGSGTLVTVTVVSVQVPGLDNDDASHSVAPPRRLGLRGRAGAEDGTWSAAAVQVPGGRHRDGKTGPVFKLRPAAGNRDSGYRDCRWHGPMAPSLRPGLTESGRPADADADAGHSRRGRCSRLAPALPGASSSPW